MFGPAKIMKWFDGNLQVVRRSRRKMLAHILDVHAFRMTFCTNMAAAVIPLQTAQVAMRHSDPKLTANIYTDIDLLDVRGAMNSLPEITLGEGDNHSESVEDGRKSTE